MIIICHVILSHRFFLTAIRHRIIGLLIEKNGHRCSMAGLGKSFESFNQSFDGGQDDFRLISLDVMGARFGKDEFGI